MYRHSDGVVCVRSQRQSTVNGWDSVCHSRGTIKVTCVESISKQEISKVIWITILNNVIKIISTNFWPGPCDSNTGVSDLGSTEVENRTGRTYISQGRIET